jgi:nucleotide-binding universal stress UspA family protein
MIKSILLAVDGSSYTESVLNHGKNLAQKLDALLRVITIVDVRTYEWTLNVGSEGYMPVVPATIYQDESHKFLTERADGLISKISDHLKESNIKFECQRIDGSPVEIICDLGRQVDLIIMGARGDYEKWDVSILGATIESVSRQCQTPLMVVDKSFNNLKNIIVAYDSSDYSNKALKLAAHLANTLSLSVEVITVGNDNEFRLECLDEAKKYLKPYQFEAQYRHEAGDATEVIVEVTKNVPEYSLLVMGSYGHSRIREAILGSTTVEVMRNAIKPILMVK